MHDLAIKTDPDHQQKKVTLHKPRADDLRRTFQQHGGDLFRPWSQADFDSENIRRAKRDNAERYPLPEQPTCDFIDRAITTRRDDHISLASSGHLARKRGRVSRAFCQFDGYISACCAEPADDIIKQMPFSPARNRVENDVDEAA